MTFKNPQFESINYGLKSEANATSSRLLKCMRVATCCSILLFWPTRKRSHRD